MTGLMQASGGSVRHLTRGLSDGSKTCKAIPDRWTVMREVKIVKAVGLACLLVMSACAPKAPAHIADTIFHGGPIVTVNQKQPEVSALAVRDGNIIAVGESADILTSHAGETTKVIDLKGRTLMPGFVEPHVHISQQFSQRPRAGVRAEEF